MENFMFCALSGSKEANEGGENYNLFELLLWEESGGISEYSSERAIYD